MWFLTLIVFVFILGLIVLVHELGHFLWAKKFGVYIYEFSIGMGPVVYSRKGKKDGILYNIRALPIGGFVSMAGEVYEDDKKVPKDRCLCNKPVWQRVIVMAAGVINNFIMAIAVLLIMALFWGSNSLTPKIEAVEDNYPMAEAGIVKGDVILAINNHKVSTWDEAQIVLHYKNKNDYYEFRIEHEDGTIDNYKITPKYEEVEDGSKQPVFGVHINQEKTYGLWNKIKYAFEKFFAVVSSMWLTIAGLITGKISVDALSGPVGIYTVVGQSVSYGLYYVIYLIAYLSINVGVINILPFPAFDGGRILFLIIEKIKGSPVNQKFENWCHTIGFALLMLLILYVTINDIIKLF
ncbi:MAG: RIP metalloprotease RseP [Firmicutes bacterium]|nr:RIP metalloprotease RseP [Bacillota bacterium]